MPTAVDFIHTAVDSQLSLRGQWFPVPVGIETSPVVTAERIYARPILTGASSLVVQAARTVALVTSWFGRVGVYWAEGPDYYPSSLMMQTGTLGASGADLAESFTGSGHVLWPNRVWWLATWANTAHQHRAYSEELHFLGANTPSQGTFAGIIASYAINALPAQFPSVTSLTVTTLRTALRVTGQP